MTQELLIRALLTWVLIIPVAILNGAIRNLIYQPHVGPLLAHQISSFTGSAAIITLTYFMLKDYVVNVSVGQLLLIGLLWVGLTIIFEFGFGHFVMKQPWEKLLADYNIFKGRLWVMVLLVTFLAPVLVKKIQEFLTSFS